MARTRSDSGRGAVRTLALVAALLIALASTAAVVLSDDRIILRAAWERIEMHGTPWHGDAGLAVAHSWPLSSVFFLCQAAANRARRLPAPAFAARMMAASFLPFHDRQALANTLAFYDRVSASVPAYELDFTPDGRAVELAARMAEEE